MSFLSDAGKKALQDLDYVSIGHLITLQLPGSGSNYVYLTDFRKDLVHDGKTFVSGRIKSVGDVRQTKSLTSFDVPIQVTGLKDDELSRALNSTAYMGNSIKIERVFLDHTDTYIQLTDTSPAIIYFQGEIKSIGIRDDLKLQGNSQSTITWTCSSLLNNFNRVNGRITDDASHRGLVDQGGKLVPSGSAKKIAYQTDKGFFHSNQSISVLAQYQTKERRYKLVSKKGKGLKGLLGIKSYETQEYWETVTKEVDMDINLSAKYLPVIYGVQRTPGIPIFVDTPVNNPNEVWAVYAFCEGEIDGFLDFYIDDQPLICVNDTDGNNRVCFGNKRYRGDTISVARPVGGAPASSNSAPTIHGQQYTFNDGSGSIDFWVYHGKSDQTATQELVTRAQNKFFKLQHLRNYGPEYWDDNFKLLDTAYVVMRIDISEERTSIPPIEAEIQGKKVAIYDENGIVSNDKTSLNFAWQTLDYMSSNIYGAGIPLELLPIDSFIESAKLMDLIDASYDPTWVPYWRYLGWDRAAPEYRQIMQGSTVFDTSAEVFKNLQAILIQADASVNIINGKYRYSVEALRTPVADIHIDDIKEGSFSLLDTSSMNKYNSIQASISDPANSWNTTAVTFYNETFLQEDFNKENKGNVTFPFITNYYTARARAERLLKKSRLTKKTTFVLPFRYADLAPNDPITFTHPRYKWDKKEFMIEDLRWTRYGDIQVTLVEYSKDVFINSDQTDNSSNQDNSVIVDVLPPTNLVFDPSDHKGEIGVQGTLKWTPSLTLGVAFYSVRRTGTTDIVTVPVAPGSSQTEYSHIVRNLNPGIYTFQVRAVNAAGKVSAPATIEVDIDPSLNIPVVPNFRVVNVGSTSNIFVGGDLELAWDKFSETYLGLQYELRILNPNGTIVRTMTLGKDVHAFTYTLQNNIDDYRGPTSGFYRELSAEIRAIGTGGARSVDWAQI